MPQTTDPNYVNAVVRGDVPGATTTCITVFCDVCGVEHTGDYIVGEADDSPTRLGYARAHMREQGWRCDERGDICPSCVLAEALSNVRVRFWTCKAHRRGRVEWRGDVAHCLEDGCDRSSASAVGR